MEQTTNILPLWLQFIGPIIVAIIASLAGLLGLRKQLRKDEAEAHYREAEAAQAIQEAAVALIAPYETKVNILEKKIGDLECEVKDLIKERNALKARVVILETGIDSLVDQLTKAGLTPVWTRNNKDS